MYIENLLINKLKAKTQSFTFKNTKTHSKLLLE